MSNELEMRMETLNFFTRQLLEEGRYILQKDWKQKTGVVGNKEEIEQVMVKFLKLMYSSNEDSKSIIYGGKDKSFIFVVSECWDLLKSEIQKVMEEFSKNEIINAVTNETCMCLVPEKNNRFLENKGLQAYKPNAMFM